MPFLQLTEHTWLDLVVNMVPLILLLVLDAMFLLYNPWGWNLRIVFFWHFLVLFPFTVLSVITYFSGRAIQRDEQRV